MTVVGSADAFNSSGRAHSCYLLEGSSFEGPVMVDFGATALARLRALGREPGELTGLLITHLHGDHIGGLPFFLIDALFNTRRTAPFQIMGPVGTRDAIDRLMRATYGELADFERPYPLTITETRPDTRVEFGGLQVATYPADHMDPPDAPLCLAVTMDGARVAFSGDTSMCDGLRAAMRDADLAIVECTGMTHPIGRHCAWTDWLAELPATSARRVVLTHLGSDVRAAAEAGSLVVAEGPPLEFAEDGKRLTP